jgi:hypothetical protein
VVVFFEPVWLLLLIPLGVAWFVWPLASRGLHILRAIILFLVVLALAQLAISLPDRSGTVVVVADRSESMPKHATTAQIEAIELLHRAMRAHDQLGVVAFGRQAVVEQQPQHGKFGGFTAQVGTEHSDLSGAIEAALTLIPPEAGGRILVLSDGKWTGKDPSPPPLAPWVGEFLLITDCLLVRRLVTLRLSHFSCRIPFNRARRM